MPRLKLKKDGGDSKPKERNETLGTNLNDNEGEAKYNSQEQKNNRGGKGSRALTIKEIMAKMKKNGSSSENTKGGGGLQNEGGCIWEARGETEEGDRDGKQPGNGRC